MSNVLPTGSEERKRIPLTTGVLDYFSAALAEVAKVSVLGNDKHNPGQPLHWSRGKSQDHADCIGRHLVERGSFDEIEVSPGHFERIRHSAEGAWRYLALLQEELEAAGAPPSRASRFTFPAPTMPKDPQITAWAIYKEPGPKRSWRLWPRRAGKSEAQQQQRQQQELAQVQKRIRDLDAEVAQRAKEHAAFEQEVHREFGPWHGPYRARSWRARFKDNVLDLVDVLRGPWKKWK
jgi:hypothetical protein